MYSGDTISTRHATYKQLVGQTLSLNINIGLILTRQLQFVQMTLKGGLHDAISWYN